MCSFSDEYTKILKSIEIKNNYTNAENTEIVKKIDDIDKVIREEILNYNKKIELLRDDREKLIILLSQLADKSSEIEKAFSNVKSSNIIEYSDDIVKESNIIESQPVKPQKKSKSKKEVVDNVIENNKEIIDEPVVEKIEEPKITKKSHSKK